MITKPKRGARTPGIVIGRLPDGDWRLSGTEWLAVACSYYPRVEVGARALAAIKAARIAKRTCNLAEQRVAQGKARQAIADYRKISSSFFGKAPARGMGWHAIESARLRRSLTFVTREYIARQKLEEHAPAAKSIAEDVRAMGDAAKRFVAAFKALGPSGRSVVATEFECLFPQNFGAEPYESLTSDERMAVGGDIDGEMSPVFRLRDVADLLARIGLYAPQVADDLADEQGVVTKDSWVRWVTALTKIIKNAGFPDGAGSDLLADNHVPPFIALVNSLMGHLPTELRHHFIDGELTDVDGKSRCGALAKAIQEARSDKVRRKRWGQSQAIRETKSTF